MLGTSSVEGRFFASLRMTQQNFFRNIRLFLSDKKVSAYVIASACAIVLSGCFTPAPRFRSSGETSTGTRTGAAVDVPPVGSDAVQTQEGIASYYGAEFQGRKTSSGEIFDKDKLTAAHLKFPFGTRLRVVNLDNGKTCEVVVNDRGPFVADRIIDLSYGAAKDIGMVGAGTAHVRLEVIEWGKK